MENDKTIIIAQIMGKMIGGGVESVVMNYYRNIDRNKIQFDFICDEDSTRIPYEEIKKLGGKVILIPSYTKILKYHRELKKILIKGKYKIVHSHINTLSFFSLCAAKAAGVQIRIAHSHATSSKKEVIRNFIKNILKRFSRLYANHFMACSYIAGEWMFGKKLLSKNKIYILNNAIDIKNFSYNLEMRRKIRKIYNIKEEQKVVGHVGRMVKTKNHKFLLNVFYEFQKHNNAVLMLLGDGILKNKIEQQAFELGIKDKIIFVGIKDNIYDYYQAFDLLILPSLYEGFGNVTIESQASNLPCIVSSTVPSSTKITEDFVFLNLKDSYENWSLIGKKLIKNNIRRSNYELLKNYGYDIVTESKKLEKYYINCLKEIK